MSDDQAPTANQPPDEHSAVHAWAREMRRQLYFLAEGHARKARSLRHEAISHEHAADTLERLAAELERHPDQVMLHAAQLLVIITGSVASERQPLSEPHIAAEWARRISHEIREGSLRQ